MSESSRLKMIIILMWMSLAIFGSTQSASFECLCGNPKWGTFSTIYLCAVQYAVNITSPDAAQIDSISVTHQAGYNNDNVEAFAIYIKGQVHYFPRGLNKFFKNLKAIEITGTGLKEIHQSDLKDFPKLLNIYLHSNNLEILEENLFEFNPNLEYIYLPTNKISHIDPNVFDKLIKLKGLYLNPNTCISMNAVNNPTELQNVIKTAKVQCTNSDYSNLEQQVKYLEFASTFLNSENLKKKLENLENEIKDSKFSNFFQEKLHILNAVLIEKEKKDKIFGMCSVFESKVDDVSENMKDLVALTSNQTDNGKAEFAALNDKLVVQDSKISGIEEKLTHISGEIEMIKKNYEDLNRKFTNLLNSLENNLPGFHYVT